MGTDIHCAIERHDGERWRFVAPLELGRNRHLFHVLALGDHPIAAPRGLPRDGDPEADTVLPELGENDGLDYGDRFGDYGRSHLTLAELRGFDWDRVLDEEDTTGDIPLRDRDLSVLDRDRFETTQGERRWEPFARWSLTPPHRPDFYYSGVRRAFNVTLIEDDAEARRLLSEPPVDDEYVWVRIRWRETIGERCAEFLRWIQSQDALDGDRTRIVFGFDS